MKLSIGLKVANSLSLTPQLQQAIRLLQLSSLELEQEIQLQLDSNPLLDKVEEQLNIESLASLEPLNILFQEYCWIVLKFYYMKKYYGYL